MCFALILWDMFMSFVTVAVNTNVENDQESFFLAPRCFNDWWLSDGNLAK